jgi:hypothetical protein
MFSDAPLPAFVGPARAGASIDAAASMYDDVPDAVGATAPAAAAAAAALSAAMPPPRSILKKSDAKFIGFGGISAAYDDVYVAAFCMCLRFM